LIITEERKKIKPLRKILSEKYRRANKKGLKTTKIKRKFLHWINLFVFQKSFSLSLFLVAKNLPKKRLCTIPLSQFSRTAKKFQLKQGKKRFFQGAINEEHRSVVLFTYLCFFSHGKKTILKQDKKRKVGLKGSNWQARSTRF